MPETDLRKPIIKQLRECNALVFCIVGHVRQERFWPDTYISHVYWQGFIEFKGENTKVDEKQKHIIKELNKRNPNSAFICRLNENSMWRLQDADGRDLVLDRMGGKELLNVLSKLKRSTL